VTNPRWPSGSGVGSAWSAGQTPNGRWLQAHSDVAPNCPTHSTTPLKIVGVTWRDEWGRNAYVCWCSEGNETWHGLPNGIVSGSEDVGGIIGGPYS